MNKALKKKWVDALRSGEFNQTTGKLCRQEELGASYCCLGVLCKVAGLDFTNDHGIVAVRYKDGPAGSDILPVMFVRDNEIRQADQTALIKMNDDQMLGFNEIADWIEEHM